MPLKTFPFAKPRLLLLALFGILYIGVALQMQAGEWDAFAIWNMRAKFLFWSDDPLTAFTVRDLPHLDYPPLLPALVALGWKAAGTTTPLIPIALHGVVFLALLSCFRPAWAVLLVGAVTLTYATYQYADLPLALTLALAVAAYNGNRPATVAVALGIGALVKNEGLMILAAFFVVWSLLEWRIPWRGVLTAAPFVVAVMVFKAITPANDLMGSSGILVRLFDFDRYAYIVPKMLEGLLTFGSGAGLVLLVALALTRARVHLSVPLAVVGVVWLGYLLIYGLTPNDLEWHISTSYDRLLLHLFPALALACGAGYSLPDSSLVKLRRKLIKSHTAAMTNKSKSIA